MKRQYQYYYILDNDGRTPVPVDDAQQWYQWRSDTGGVDRVARDTIGQLIVSTVFLGINHQFADGDPLLFETMVFATKSLNEDLWQDRCSTWVEAEAQHVRGIRWAKANQPRPKPRLIASQGRILDLD